MGPARCGPGRVTRRGCAWVTCTCNNDLFVEDGDESEMAPAKHARIVDHDSDDTEPDTPKPNHRQGSKKRISDAHGLDADTSFTSDPGRAPLRTVNINDDAAEKRRRRKSTKLAVIESAEAGPSSGERMDTGESSRAALAKQKQQQQLNSAVPPPVINVPLDVMNSNFEEWMKMATDNVGYILPTGLTCSLSPRK